MRVLRIALAWLALTGAAYAQAQLGAGQVLGNNTAATRSPQAASVTSILDRALGSTRGSILRRGASGWEIVVPGTSGLPLTSAGAGADPLYQAIPIASAVSGLGTGIAASLAANVGAAGAPVLFNGAGGTPSSMVGTNITGTAAGLTAGTASAVAVGGITGAGTGCITWLTTPSSANLRGCLTDESGTGVAYFQGGDIGTPSAGNGSNLTALNATNLGSGAVPAARMPALTGDCTTTAGAVATTCTSINGVNQTTAWGAYTPTSVFATPGTSVIGTQTGAFKQIGKTTFFSADVTITTVGTGTGNFLVNLPATAKAPLTIVSCGGKEVITTGKLLAVGGGSTQVVVNFYDNTSLATGGNGTRIQFGCTYEAN